VCAQGGDKSGSGMHEPIDVVRLITSEMSSITAYKLCHLMLEAGLPPGVVNMVFGDLISD